jgi:hypothetical protein
MKTLLLVLAILFIFTSCRTTGCVNDRISNAVAKKYGRTVKKNNKNAFARQKL